MGITTKMRKLASHIVSFRKDKRNGEIKKEEIEKMWAEIQGPEDTLDRITRRVNSLNG